MKTTISLLMFLFVLTGCAVAPDTVEISYAPRPNIKTLANAYKIKAYVEVDDQRLDKYRMNDTRNTFIKTTPIYPKNDVVSTLQWAVGSELRNLGLTLSPDNPDIFIVTELARFDLQYVTTNYIKGTATANFHAHIMVQNRQRQFLYGTTVSVQTSGEDFITDKAETSRMALNKALETAIDKLFTDKAFVSSLQSASAPTASSAQMLPVTP